MRTGATILALSLASALVMTTTTAVAGAQTVNAQHVKFVYPDSPQTSNAPYPHADSRAALQQQLRTITVVTISGRQESLRDYLRHNKISSQSVVAVKVQGDAATVFLAHR